MKSNYDVLGNYIRLIDTRNKDKVTNKVMGINIDKFFMPSVANVIGTDLSKYKLITKGKFACNPMHVGRDERLPIALYEKVEPALVSPAYFMFEIIDNTVLDENYLMMWFRRAEFDRICWLHTDGSVRGGITWDDICRMELPVPDIGEQRKIVEAYKVVEDRIELKRKINDNLEATALAIYKKIFIQDINIEQLPQGWEELSLGEVATLSAGGDRPQICSDISTPGCDVPIYSNGIDNEGLYGYTDIAKIFVESVTVSARGTIGYVFLRETPYVPIVRLISVIPNDRRISAKYLYFALSIGETHSTGTSQQQITVPDFKKKLIVVPSETAMQQFLMRVIPLFETISKNKFEIEKLKLFQNNILTVLSR